MMTYPINKGNSLQDCELCGEGTARLSTVGMSFKYGVGASSVELTADVPVWECETCGEAYTAEGAEAAQHDRICEHLGRLKPSQIVAMRNKLGLTQSEFADHLGISRPSVARWETGAQVQSGFYDKALREELAKLDMQEHRHVFRTDVTDRAAAALSFDLRLMAV